MVAYLSEQQLGSSTLTPSSAVRDQYRPIDSGLTMQSHVRRTVKRCFAVLRQLRTVRPQVPTSVFQSLIVALVLSWLYYCNSVLFGLPANLIQRLQSVQNPAAWLIFRIRQSEHITPALTSLRKFASCASQNISSSNWQLWRIDRSTAPLRPIYSRVSSLLPTWHPDDCCGLLPHIVWKFRPFVSLQMESGQFRFLVPLSGMACFSKSHLRGHSGFSDNDSKPYCFLFPTMQDTIMWLMC